MRIAQFVAISALTIGQLQAVYLSDASGKEEGKANAEGHMTEQEYVS